MGRSKKRFNERGRNSVPVLTDESEPKKIKLDIPLREDKYDAANAFVLPSAKRKTKKQETTESSKPKPLSKKQRKRLQYLLEKKKKKLNRDELLKSLSEVQATKEELQIMTSISAMQTKGLKRHFIETELKKMEGSGGANSIKGSKQCWKSQGESSASGGVQLNVDSSSDSETTDENEDESSTEDKDVPNKKPEDDSETGEPTQIDVQLKYTEGLTQQDLPDQQPVSGDGGKDPEKTLIGTASKESAKINIPDPKALSTSTSRTLPNEPAEFVPVKRTPEIQACRLALPVLSEEQPIVEAVRENDVVILCGETGSGKTTQVPQFLYEAGYTRKGKICVTEPRRVAAISMSKRVAQEMSLSTRVVSYQIRFEGNVTQDTEIKFVTDGVLLKEVEQDFLLSKYSVIIIDEAHERSVYSDILIGLLSRIVPLRKKKGIPLKMIIMSATLRVEDFTQNERLFKVPPVVIKVDSRQYPVTVHFNKRTHSDYLTEAYKKVCKIHQKLPDGGMLVFLTGQHEVLSLCKKLRAKFPLTSHSSDGARRETGRGEKELDKKEGAEDMDSNSESDRSGEIPSIRQKKNPKRLQKKKLNQMEHTPKIDLSSYSVQPPDEEELYHSESDEDLSIDSDQEDAIITDTKQPLYVLPLFSLLSADKQAKVFRDPPEGSRLCVVATNVAETSITIPRVKYVVDTGKVKVRVYDKVTGVSAFMITWTSKASANQRAGRAGRLGPGHCYRLYSSAVFNDEFPLFTEPEITRKPIDDLVLQMKAMNIDNVINFPFPSQPDKAALQAAEKRLILLGALEEKTIQSSKQDTSKVCATKITPLGTAMSCFPIGPSYGKMLVLSHQHSLLPYAIAIVSAMTVQEIFVDNNLPIDNKGKSHCSEDRKRKWMAIQRWAGQGNSLALGDVMVLLKAVGASEFMGCTPEFCEKYGLRHKAMIEIRKLRVQLTNEVNLIIPGANICVDPTMEPPSDLQAKLLRQIVLTGFSDHVARKIPDDQIKEDDKAKLKNSYECLDVESPVYIHSTSVLSKELPEFVVYQEVFETSRLYMKVVAAVEPEWLPIYAPSLCSFSKPLDDPPPYYDDKRDQIRCHMTSTYGRCAWPLPAVELNFPPGLDKYRWFGRFLLEGKVVPALKAHSDILLSPPAIMTKSWARLQPRTEMLLTTLAEQSVDSRESLLALWRKNSKYLLEEYQQWLPESMRYEISRKWPPVSLKS